MGLFESIKNIMTIPDEDDFDEDTLEETDSAAKRHEDYTPSKREVAPKIVKSKVQESGQSNRGAMQVVLVKPERFEDVRAIADHLNAGKTVVLNLEIANREESRRIVDFLSGVAYANGGNMRKVAVSTFIIVANNIDVMGELMLDEYDEGKLYF